MKLAFSTLACPDWTVEQIMEAAIQYRYEALEWRLADGELLTSKTSGEVRRRIRQVSNQGLSIVCLDTSCQFVQANTTQRMAVVHEAQAMSDIAAELGAPYLRVFAGSLPPGMTFTDIFEPTVEILAQVATYASARGVTLAMETHEECSQSSHVLSFYNALRPLAFAVIWDVFHTYRMGEAVADSATMLKDILAHIHIRDAYRVPGKMLWQTCLLGKGELPIEECIHLLQTMSYPGYLVVEWEKYWQPELAEPDIALAHFADHLRHMHNASGYNVSDRL